MTKSPGLLSYYEICDNIRNHGWTNRFSFEEGAMYAFKGNQWVGYDDTNSLFIKINYILQRGLGGGFLWSMDLDDFTGKYCGQGPYPLVSLVRRRLIGNLPPTAAAGSWTPSREQPVWTTQRRTQPPAVVTEAPWRPVVTEAPWRPIATEAPWNPVVTEAPWRPIATEAPWNPVPAETPSQPAVTEKPVWGRSTVWFPRTGNPWKTEVKTEMTVPTVQPRYTTLARPARENDGNRVQCQTNGEYLADPNDCNSYFQCIHVGSPYERMLKFQCPKALAFNPRLVTCDIPDNVPECGRG